MALWRGSKIWLFRLQLLPFQVCVLRYKNYQHNPWKAASTMELSIVWKEGSCIILTVMCLIGDYITFSMGLAEMIISCWWFNYVFWSCKNSWRNCYYEHGCIALWSHIRTISAAMLCSCSYWWGFEHILTAICIDHSISVYAWSCKNVVNKLSFWNQCSSFCEISMLHFFNDLPKSSYEGCATTSKRYYLWWYLWLMEKCYRIIHWQHHIEIFI